MASDSSQMALFTGSNSSADLCREYADNVTMSLYMPIQDKTRILLDFVILPTICIFGILGNCLNLFILSQKHMKSSLDRMEHSVYMGLMSLAASDMLQCLFIMTLIFNMPQYASPLTSLQAIHVFFYTYRIALCNIFLFNSTWLTVLMAIGRYIAICHPMRARSFVKIKVTTILIFLIFVTSVLVCLPYFWKFYLKDYECTTLYDDWPRPPGCDCVVSYRQPRLSHVDFHRSYHYFWMVVEFVTPLGVLIFCNICLIRSLKQSHLMQQQYRANQVRDPSLRITPTLVAVIVFFIILISPAEILKFIPPTSWEEDQVTQRTIKGISNILQALNAAVNFILYCVINVHFRNTIKRILCCTKRPRGRLVGSLRSDQIRTNHTSIMYDAETEL